MFDEKDSIVLTEMLLILMPARDMVCVTNGSMGKVVLCLNISEETETSVLFSVSLRAHQSK